MVAEAVQAFQKINGINSVTGKVESMTLSVRKQSILS
ncbi:MAG: peptidoglycan-binding protein [Ruminococcus sp.]|nr:peptidoglycan-binding protein [Ruminococcus sp.]